jgi:hypothetical protein
LNIEKHQIGDILSDRSEIDVKRHHIYKDGAVRCPICKLVIGNDWEELNYKSPCLHLEFEYVTDEACVFRPELERMFQAVKSLHWFLNRDIGELGRYEPSLESWKGEAGYERVLLILLGQDPERIFLRVEDDHGDILMGFSPERM